MVEHYFNCPHCWQNISMLLDKSVNYQDYIEDCEVCCNPIRIKITFDNDELIDFESSSVEQ